MDDDDGGGGCGSAKRVFLFRGVADFQTCASVSGRARGAIDGLKEMKGPSNDPFDLGQEWRRSEGDGGDVSSTARCARETTFPSTTTLNSETAARRRRGGGFHEPAVPSRGMEVEDAPEEALRAMRALMEERDVWAPPPRWRACRNRRRTTSSLENYTR